MAESVRLVASRPPPAPNRGPAAAAVVDTPVDSVDEQASALRTLCQKIATYSQPRHGMPQDRATPSALGAGMMGGLEGFFTGAAATHQAGPVAMVVGAVDGLLAGALGGAVGTAVTKKTESFWKGLAAGGITGTVASVAVAVAAVAVLHVPLAMAAALVTGLGLVGGLSAAAGTLAGGKSFANRSQQSGAFLTSSALRMLVPHLFGSALFGGSLAPLTGGLAAGLAGKAKTKLGKVLTAVGLGGASGAALGVLGGPVGMAVGAGIGAATSLFGLLIGKSYRQGLNNLTEDVGNAECKLLDKVIQKREAKGKEVTESQCLAVGAATTALPFSLYSVLGGLFVAGTLGAALGPALIPALLAVTLAPPALGAWLGFSSTKKQLHPEQPA